MTLTDVSLSYGDTKVLNGLDLTAKAGQTTALVGASGAGKSTLVALLLRLYEPEQGKILIDGVDTTTVTQESLRRNIGMVTHDHQLFGLARVREI